MRYTRSRGISIVSTRHNLGLRQLIALFCGFVRTLLRPAVLRGT